MKSLERQPGGSFRWSCFFKNNNFVFQKYNPPISQQHFTPAISSSRQLRTLKNITVEAPSPKANIAFQKMPSTKSPQGQEFFCFLPVTMFASFYWDELLVLEFVLSPHSKPVECFTVSKLVSSMLKPTLFSWEGQ